MIKHLNCGDTTDCLGITAAFEIIRTHNTRKRLTNKYKNNLNNDIINLVDLLFSNLLENKHGILH